MEDVFRYIDDHVQDAVDDLFQLCRQPTVSAQNLGIQETAQLLRQMMGGCGVSTSLLPKSQGGSPVVYGEIPGAAARTLLFYNHYDVQPADPLDEWQTSPFEPTRKGDVLYGRGVADNKGNIVARLWAIKALQATKGKLPLCIKFCIEGDEEVGSPNLDAFVQEYRQLLQADACIWEGGGVNWAGRPLITLGLKGILYVELEARGAIRDVHSSLGTVVPNPAWRLIWALNTLKDQNERVLIQGFYDRVRPPSSLELAAVQNIPPEDEQLRQNLGLERLLLGVSGYDFQLRHLFEPTCSICGLVSGYIGEGSKTVLPNVAQAKVDFRLVPDQRPDDILAKLRRHLDKHGFSDIVIKAEMHGENPARTPLDAPFVRLVAETARTVYGAEPVIVPNMAGSGPMYSFTDTLGMPVASSGVEYPDCRAHAPNENVRLGDFVNGIKHAAAIMMRMGQN